MKAQGAYFSIAGPGHANQDAVLPLCHIRDFWVAAIADGVGSYEGAALASRTAVETVSTVTNQNSLDVAEVFRAIKRQLQTLASLDPATAHMATTLSAVWIKGAIARVGHVGDTRIYHLRNAGIVNRTRDQTEVERLLQEGVLSPARAKRYYRRNVLLSALSADGEYDLYEEEFELFPKDRLILLSDGVHSKVPRRTVRDLAAVQSDPEGLCSALRNAVESSGAEDDYSAICINLN